MYNLTREWKQDPETTFYQKATEIESLVYRNSCERRFLVEEKIAGENVHRLYMVETEEDGTTITSVTCIYED